LFVAAGSLNNHGQQAPPVPYLKVDALHLILDVEQQGDLPIHTRVIKLALGIDGNRPDKT
jgi:hypothetical protein